MKKKAKAKRDKSRTDNDRIIAPKDGKEFLESNGGSFNTGKRKINVISFVLILLVGLLAYVNSFNCSLHFDDVNIFTDAVMREGAKLSDWISLFPSRPIGIMTFALNYHFHKLNVWGYHLVNLTIHLFNALLIWWLTRLTFSTPILTDERICKHRDIIALFVGLLFVAHPLATQSVTYIAQRFASLATMFYLLSMVLYVKGKLWSEEQKLSWIFYGGSVVSAVLGILTKEIVFTLPFAIFLYEICFFKTEPLKVSIRDRGLNLFVIIFVIFILVFLRNNSLKIFEAVPPGQGYDYAISAKEYLITQFSVIATYMRLLILPVNQNLDYDYPVSHSLFEMAAAGSLLFLLIVLAAGVFAFRKYRLIAFGIFWFFLTLSVESSIIPISQNVIFEHRTYLPSFGFFVAMVGAVFYFTRDEYVKFLAGALVLVIMVMAVSAYQRNRVWKTDYTLWSDCVKKSPNKARALCSLGRALTELGDFNGSLVYFDKSIARNPKYDIAYYNRGRSRAQLGRYADAIADYSTAIKLNPRDANAYYNMAFAKTQLKDYSGAVSDYEASLKISPYDADTYNNIGNIKAEFLKDFSGSIKMYDQAISLRPQNALAYANRGNSKMMLKDRNGACEDWRYAARMGYEQVLGLLQNYCR